MNTCLSVAVEEMYEAGKKAGQRGAYPQRELGDFWNAGWREGNRTWRIKHGYLKDTTAPEGAKATP